MPIHIKKENPGASARDFFLFRFFDNGKVFLLSIFQYGDGIIAQLRRCLQIFFQTFRLQLKKVYSNKAFPQSFN
ncbi:hypothetical protein EFW57_02685 [Bacillus velezensis]|nr:hypothetical protein EFW57_02685 [Bacillus velezensis]